MARLAVVLLLSGLVSPIGFTTDAQARIPVPICRAPSVVDVMARDVRQRDHYAHIEPRLVVEYPTVTPNVVQCGVTVLSLHYDAIRAGGWPMRYSALHEYRVRAVRHGYVVSFVR